MEAGYELLGVVTTNYDLLAERTLRHRPMSRPKIPGFYYAGIRVQLLQGAGTFSRLRGEVGNRWLGMMPG